MPSSEAHLRACKVNQSTIDYLLGGGPVHAPWVVTIAFYKALHIVEAVLARQKPPMHKNEHKSRNHFLKTDNRFKKIWVHYSVLYQASQVARYLSDDKVDKEYLTEDVIRRKILDHHLKQIALSANRLIGEDVFQGT
jgi:hypothetical protein